MYSDERVDSVMATATELAAVFKRNKWDWEVPEHEKIPDAFDLAELILEAVDILVEEPDLVYASTGRLMIVPDDEDEDQAEIYIRLGSVPVHD